MQGDEKKEKRKGRKGEGSPPDDPKEKQIKQADKPERSEKLSDSEAKEEVTKTTDEPPKEMHLVLLGIRGKNEAVVIEANFPDTVREIEEMCVNSFEGHKLKEIRDVLAEQTVLQAVSTEEMAELRKKSPEHHTSPKTAIQKWVEMNYNSKWGSTALNGLYSLLKEVIRQIAGHINEKAPREERIEKGWISCRKISQAMQSITYFALAAPAEKALPKKEETKEEAVTT